MLSIFIGATCAHAALINPTPRAPTVQHVDGMICRDGVCILEPDSMRPDPWVPTPRAGRVTGLCSHWNLQRGYGFIALVHENARVAAEMHGTARQMVFVHHSDISKETGFRSLTVGERVEFSIATHAENGKTKALEVTGPGGADVTGAPCPARRRSWRCTHMGDRSRSWPFPSTRWRPGERGR